MQITHTIETHGPGLYEFTDDARQFIQNCFNANTHDSGLLTLFVRHTSCSLVIQENADPDVQKDLQDYFSRLVPLATASNMGWIRHRSEGPDDMPAHIKAALTQVSIGVPITKGDLGLGTWQGIYLFEHRETAHSRQVIMHLTP